MCGWGRQNAVVPQNNWLFTQHISKTFDASTYNYDVAIQVEAIYSLQSCRERQGCKQRFNLLHYMTNSQRLPSTSGSGYMNTRNYVNFAVPEGEPSANNNNTYTFTLPSSSTGFYLAAQDIGSCIALSTLRVYRNNCRSILMPLPQCLAQQISISVVLRMQWSLEAQESHVAVMEHGALKILYVSVDLGIRKDRCSALVCFHPYSHVTNWFKFGCLLFWAACEAGEYRSMGDTTCQSCPDNTVVTEEAAAVCQCLTGYYRVTEQGAQRFLTPTNEQPSDPCTSKFYLSIP